MTELKVSVGFLVDYGYCYNYGVTMTDVIVVAMLRTLLVDGGYDAEWCVGLLVYENCLIMEWQFLLLDMDLFNGCTL